MNINYTTNAIYKITMEKTNIKKLFESIDSFDTEGLLSYLDENAIFRFGNMPAITGKSQIGPFLDGFFKSIKAIRHDQIEIWEVDNVRIMNGRVTYTRHDGSELSVPFSNTFKMRGDKIKDYLIFADTSELYKEAPILQN